VPYKEHRDVGPLPESRLKLWRYMSLAKFIFLLQTQRLYFANAVTLAMIDPWEGVYPIDRDGLWSQIEAISSSANANQSRHRGF
jgi:hypothetical protein